MQFLHLHFLTVNYENCIILQDRYNSKWKHVTMIIDGKVEECVLCVHSLTPVEDASRNIFEDETQETTTDGRSLNLDVKEEPAEYNLKEDDHSIMMNPIIWWGQTTWQNYIFLLKNPPADDISIREVFGTATEILWCFWMWECVDLNYFFLNIHESLCLFWPVSYLQIVGLLHIPETFSCFATGKGVEAKLQDSKKVFAKKNWLPVFYLVL